MSTRVVSTRISKKDKGTLRNAGVDISAESRKHSERVAAEIRRRKSIDRLHKTIEELMPHAKRGFAVKSVREDRYGN